MLKTFKNQYKELDTEFYTTENTVLQLIPFLDKNKKYIEPFDIKQNSKIYNILKSNGFDIINKTTLFNQNDNYENRIIITNPPFISRLSLFSKLSKMSNEMYLIMPLFTFKCYTSYREKDKCKRWTDNWNKELLFKVKDFDTPNGLKKISCVFTHFIKNN